LEAIGCVFLSTRLGALKDIGDGKRLIALTEETFALIQKLGIISTSILPYLPDYKKAVQLQAEIFDICKKHVDKAKEELTDEDDSVLAKLVGKCGKDSAIPIIMSIDALMAGIDTTGCTATFLLYHLAKNPEKQEKLYQEICEVIGPKGSMSEQALGKMKYTKACQTESQRMMPAGLGTSRKTDVDMVLSGYHIPAGTQVVRIGQGMSNDSSNFPEPQQFLPERWLRGCPERTNAHSFANIPWGHGARACIGRRFAQLELYMLMVKVIQRFKLEYEGPEVGVFTKFVNQPDKAVDIKFIERQKCS